MVEIKICGFKRKKDIVDAISVGIKWIGLNFYEKSPRYIELNEAKKLIEDLSNEVRKIGVFVNPDEKKLYETVKKIKLDGIQLHGNEPFSLIDRFKKIFPEKIVIKAIRVKTKQEVLKKIKYYRMADFFLLDSYVEKKIGGTGILIDESKIEKNKLPFNKIFIAGGITPENVKDIIKKYKPFGIDIASGVEIAPGIKDIEKIKKLIEEVKNVTG
ncbi:MAG: phosphoribosylanthranilate isomerase [Candidatus Omnitrophica bacterium]|nr:phosphoribosylanthranilate isomerase [Candidatus Omnitrophota bacterium]MCM8810531.1 phosphoribosylanthranilate isomerase [Candidatus Omnitrophota bacterium]